MTKLRKLAICYLILLARIQLYKIKPHVVVLTGSVGKTSLKNMLISVLSTKFEVKSSESSYNSDIGIPMSILNLRAFPNKAVYALHLLIFPLYAIVCDWKHYDILLVEKGVEEPGDMWYLKQLTKTDIALFTNLFPVHTGNFPSVDPLFEVFKEKYKVFELLKSDGVGIINIDNENIKKYLKDLVLKNTIKTLSAIQNVADFKYCLNTDTQDLISIKVDDCTILISQPILPEYVLNLAFSYFVGKHFNISCVEIQRGIDAFKLEPSRLAFLKGINGSTVLDSSYNSSPEALKAVLKYVSKLNYSRKIVCLGDMRELGVLSNEEHLDVVSYIDSTADYAFFVGNTMAEVVYPRIKLPGDRKKIFKSSLELGDYLKHFLQFGDLAVFKGSQNTIFLEEAVKDILQDPMDVKSLCRQDAFWVAKKRKYFSSLV